MYFQAHAVSPKEFQAWVQKIKQSPEKLDLNRYKQLAKPSVGYYPVTYFSTVKPGLFEYIVRKYDPTWHETPGTMSRESLSRPARTEVAEEN